MDPPFPGQKVYNLAFLGPEPGAWPISFEVIRWHRHLGSAKHLKRKRPRMPGTARTPALRALRARKKRVCAAAVASAPGFALLRHLVAQTARAEMPRPRAGVHLFGACTRCSPGKSGPRPAFFVPYDFSRSLTQT